MPPGFFVQGLAGRLLLAAVAGLAMAVTTYLCAWINMRNAIGYRWPHERAFQQLEDLKSALDKFRQGEGKYPEKLSELSNPPPQFTRIEDSGEVLDPWENPYQYHVEGGGYTLFSFGRDGRHGGQGLDQDLDVKDLSRGVGPESWHNTVAIPTLWQFTFECGTRATQWTCVLAGVCAFLTCLNALRKPERFSWRSFLGLGLTLLACFMTALIMTALHIPSHH